MVVCDRFGYDSAMAKRPLIRSDHWQLTSTPGIRSDVADTIVLYRRLVNALCTVFLTHWPTCADANVQTLERLFHATTQNPKTAYGAWFGKHFPRVPSYLRRAATMAAHGAVSSYMTRYRTWQGGTRTRRDARPPAWGGFNGFPVLYTAQGGAGAMCQVKANQVSMKLYQASAATWTWQTVRVIARGKRHPHAQALLSPSARLKGSKLSLTFPMTLAPGWDSQDAKGGRLEGTASSAASNNSASNRAVPNPLAPVSNNCVIQISHHPVVVCAVDVGINTAATCSIIDHAGTVRARAFLSPRAVHMARLDRCSSTLRACAKKTVGGIVTYAPASVLPVSPVSLPAGQAFTAPVVVSSTVGKLSRGFCSHTYRRARHLNTEIARELSRKIIAFALQNGATVIVFEHLKGFRPKGGRRNSTLRQRFHQWQHRKLVTQVEASCQEKGIHVAFVNPRGTSSWAYDGSGRVKRDEDNASLCTFTNGKRYNTDLNASYNIGARYLITLATPSLDSNGQGRKAGKRSHLRQRTPVTLSSLWGR